MGLYKTDRSYYNKIYKQETLSFSGRRLILQLQGRVRYESINSRLAVILQERQVRERLADQVRILNQQYSLDERSSWMTYLKMLCR